MNKKINTLNQVIQTMNAGQDRMESVKREMVETYSIAVQTDFFPSHIDVAKYCSIATQTILQVEKTEIQPTKFSNVTKMINGNPKMSSTLSTQTDFESNTFKRRSISDKLFSVTTDMVVDIQPEYTVNISNLVEERLNPIVSSAFEEEFNTFISSDAPTTITETKNSTTKMYSTLSTPTEFEIVVQNSPEKLHSIPVLDLPFESAENNVNIGEFEDFFGMPRHSIEEELIPVISSKNRINPVEDYLISPIPLSNYSEKAELNSNILSEISVNTIIEKECLSPIATIPVNIIEEIGRAHV